MKNTIAALWHGQLNPESEQVALSQEELCLLRHLGKNKEKLLGVLDEQGKELFEQIENGNNEISFIELEDAFVKGFSLGARLMAEALAAAK